jgi:hypothetical protein
MLVTPKRPKTSSRSSSSTLTCLAIFALRNRVLCNDSRSDAAISKGTRTSASDARLQRRLAVAEYLIVAVSTEHAHRHVVTVHAKYSGENETGESSSVEVFTVPQVVDMMATGNSFYTYSPSTGTISFVNHDTCRVAGCLVRILRSAPDAVEDNKLELM